MVVDLTAIESNVRALSERAGSAQLMAVVKADGYGHGLVPAARAAQSGGADWLATAVLAEALRLRQAGLQGPLLAWLAAPTEDYRTAIEHHIDVAGYASWQLSEIAAAARTAGRPARVHLKIDTGLARGGATAEDWPHLIDSALRLQAEGTLDVVGVWSHFAYADEPGHPTIRSQIAAFDEALDVGQRRGLRPQIRHLANSAATLTLPEAHYDVVRPGLSVYGLSPIPHVADPAALGLRPAMSVRTRLALVKGVAAGQGVSYGHTYHTASDTRLGLVPLGYADGVPRHASNRGPVLVGGERRVVAGRVCMDQFVVDLGADDPAEAGDEVWLFGDGRQGEPTAEDWAQAAGTISYEIVTRMSQRLPRRYVGMAQTGVSEADVRAGW